jgi:hypothetical protein
LVPSVRDQAEIKLIMWAAIDTGLMLADGLGVPDASRIAAFQNFH